MCAKQFVKVDLVFCRCTKTQSGDKSKFKDEKDWS